ncbi:NAD-dependent epimerase/dehydratase family protein [Metallumcola ferriviriculae]|uniref:NAD-dependent epimerase/dehydratase family protein n=1 Tax=Metallumcola ferriviriculae TaxID=3039180 RepID=A0AAU0UN75_9FIRM|nr:NAD-dependent epimerase/dehydratase family protein [Desulfitibacteraceae bacterium MK1]
MHYLLTGGTGFIGTHLTMRLLEKNSHQVTVLDNFMSSRPSKNQVNNCTVVQGSVLDKTLVDSLVKECDQIIHLAAVVGVRQAIKKGLDGLRVNFIGTDNVLEAATKYGKEVFVSSSSAIYGKISEIPVPEEADCLLGCSYKSSWLYSVSKLAEEHLALAYFREMNTQVKIGRFFNVIGPYQTGAYGMVVPTFIKKALNNEPLPVYHTGEQTRTFVYIEDALNGLEYVLDQGLIGRVYNIGGIKEISILNLAKIIISLTGSQSQISFVPYKEAFGDSFEETARRVPDINQLQGLGYVPRFTLNQALLEIIDHHRQMGQD